MGSTFCCKSLISLLQILLSLLRGIGGCVMNANKQARYRAAFAQTPRYRVGSGYHLPTFNVVDIIAARGFGYEEILTSQLALVCVRRSDFHAGHDGVSGPPILVLPRMSVRKCSKPEHMMLCTRAS